MGEKHVETRYLSAGANRHTAVADWSPDGLVAFGADSNIALWRPHDAQPRGVTSLLSGHKDTVKAVKFLRGPGWGDEQQQEQTYLLSGADDHALKTWVLPSSSSSETAAATCVQTVQEHTASINCITTLHEQVSIRGSSSATTTATTTTTTIFATGAADASVKIWSFNGRDGAQVIQTIHPKPKFFPLALALSRLDDDNEVGGGALVLAVAGTRDVVQIFVAESSDNPEFRLQATLAGHEGWIRSLDFAWEQGQGHGGSGGSRDLLLASASQDKYIRLWRLHRGRELPAAAASGADPSLGAYLPGRSPSNKAHRLQAAGSDFTITFEALLLGHDDWIYSAKWFAGTITDGDSTRRLRLLSASADNTLAIWEADPSSGIWVTNVRLGEISREKGATTATGSTGGFWTGLWSPDGASVACLGRTGSWRVWAYDAAEDRWNPRIGVSGHTRAVTGIAWAKSGDYLLSTSADQTTRLHGNWQQHGGSGTWHEMARPQIHGYDLNCLDSLGDSRFVSGADEKLMRVFDEPKAVAKLLSRLCGIGGGASAVEIDTMPDAANMPVLGLSNKAVEEVTAAGDDNAAVEAGAAVAEGEDGEANKEAATAARKSALEVDHPPLEDALSRHTLWPEAEKLYGHGYEISCLAASHGGDLVASACKASSVNHAVIRLFETRRWTEVRPPLAAHTLTATRLRFSPDDRFLLSVGRDRQWAVFERGRAKDDGDVDVQDTVPGYTLLQANPKGHMRMILDAAWAPTTKVVFATAGRDRNVKIWRRGDNEKEKTEETEGGGDSATTAIVCVTTITELHPATAIDFLPHSDSNSNSGRFVLAVGNESGKISIYFLDPTSLTVSMSFALQPELCLVKPVLQLAWRPHTDSGELAVAGDDGSLRVYRIAENEP